MNYTKKIWGGVWKSLTILVKGRGGYSMQIDVNNATNEMLIFYELKYSNLWKLINL